MDNLAAANNWIRLRIGVYVFGIATVAAGILDLIWGNLKPRINPFRR